MKFNVSVFDKDTSARSGTIQTDHGTIETPTFMPVGTLGTVKGIHTHELKEQINPHIILSNTYHLYLKPTTSILEATGGIHKFIGWDRPILTDSGGYQVYSLANRRKITEEGVQFKSHIDGSYHFFSPENAIDIQRKIGADIIMAFDECTPYPCDYKYAKQSMERTHRWLTRCLNFFNNQTSLYGYEQTLFPIVQGSTFKDLRKESAEYITNCNAKGNAIGGLSVGEPKEEMYKMTDICCSILPKDKPRYLMGVGTPENILECIALGIDMFDCVMPTRNGRNGMVFTSEGIINIKNKKWEKDFSPLDSNTDLNIDKQYSKAYVRHLFHCNEALGRQIASIHNLSFYLWLVKTAKHKIETNIFSSWKNKMIPKLTNRL